MNRPTPQTASAAGPSREASDRALEALGAVYADLDALLATLPVACQACGRCCDFVRNDYRLYASLIERLPVLRFAGPPRLTAAGHCGFLAGGRCSVHRWRPLSCRVFFCAPEHKAREQELYHAFQQRLRAATDRLGLEWDYAPFFAGQAGGPAGGQNSVLP
ncbi:MAG TPA: YkgJ family cysteine cluster protein [Planctomycetota bacterium]|nr:YkgJ family cysteine cluster protein [Planctomycetota bacterium]HRR80813.1 YkgJ family cysteine cluster protein [Planctomycetota bacterium]HRT96562.1 YkgJ family cysteine cluster protein [Planctomycetota bacterium]